MWTVEQQSVCTEQLREHSLMEEQEEMEMLESVLLLLMDLSVLELCPTAGVQDREIQTVLTVDCAGKELYMINRLTSPSPKFQKIQ